MNRLISVLLFSIITHYSFSQTIVGFVFSNHQALEGVTVYNIKTGNHVHTNEAGYFKIKGVLNGDTLLLSHVSFYSKKVVVASDTLNISLEPAPFELDAVTVFPRISHLNIISNIDLKVNPVNSSQELLRTVPGLFIGQHAGGGKAEQIFLRGFDIDHGTDINISVDGIPVNMVSHAHGQGYADLHFLIPETVEKIDFDKGPYYANKGNLATAGYVSFSTKEQIANNSLTLEAGKFNTIKTLGIFSLVNNTKQAAWLATDYVITDGYFESPQHFNRINIATKFTSYLPANDKLSVGFSTFSSKWDASGQIPNRAVENGSITRFGSIDNTEGGNTHRSNINLQYVKHIHTNTFVKNTFYYSNYYFELYSNFTFFLKDPINGDQIRQKESRNIFGFESELNKNFYWRNIPIKLQAALGLRNDAINNVELSHTVNRQVTLQQLVLGDVYETNVYSYINAEVQLGKWLINPAIRLDHMKFDYINKLAALYQMQSEQKTQISPKLNFLYNHNKNLQAFLKLGKGFHSNDTRVVVAKQGKEILPSAYGADVGLVWKPIPRMVVNAAFWYLYLQQEFVYVGDEAIVEPSGRTQRKGIDFGLRYQIGKSIFFNTDITYTHARSIDNAKGNDYIPLAPKFTFTSGISLKQNIGFNASIKTRLLGNRSANEDNSIVAKGYCITDMNISYQWKDFSIGVITENIFNTDWKETQFATLSQLKNEIAPVEEIHFTPGTPFNIKFQLLLKF